MLMGSYSGSIAGPLLFNTSDQPYYRKGLDFIFLTSLIIKLKKVAQGLVAILICFSCSFVLVALLLIYLRYRNKLNMRRRVSKGKGMYYHRF